MAPDQLTATFLICGKDGAGRGRIGRLDRCACTGLYRSVSGKLELTGFRGRFTVEEGGVHDGRQDVPDRWSLAGRHRSDRVNHGI